MELKAYQQKIIADLVRYLEIMNNTRNYAAAFRYFWNEKCAPMLGIYQDITPGVPNLCFKVPTGGGKTFLACHAIRPIFEALPFIKARAVVWLVPSEAILTQTLKTLKSPSHPYRQKLNVDFGGRVEVYSKEDLLCGHHFSPGTVAEQVSVMVLSYDSFRGNRKDGLKAYQENSALYAFSRVLGMPEKPIANADDSALFQIINQLNPLVIVDESHHARSELSLEMLQNFNPCFILDLTATPKKESNIISYVDAVQLKNEHMVKLPVIVYNRGSANEVIVDAIDLRNQLEKMAGTGPYIRPIVLFQAQPKGKEQAATFEKLREKLIEIGIPKSQIAIRTADINELKNVDLLSPKCEIRYIITVNALKEGWDCPFAYILASLANRTSAVEVEQILGRVLRLPYTQEHEQPMLNMSYVLTSSADFEDTVKRIVKGLNHAGFSDKDYRLSTAMPTAMPITAQLPLPIACEPKTDEGFAELDSTAISKELKRRETAKSDGTDTIRRMMDEAVKAATAYQDKIAGSAQDPFIQSLPFDVRDKISHISVKSEWAQDIETLRIPQFYQVIPHSLFCNGNEILLNKACLAKGFTLQDKSTEILFGDADEEIAKIDIQGDATGIPKVFRLSSADQKYFKQYFNALPPAHRIKLCKNILFDQLNRMNMVDARELYEYIERVVSAMDNAQLANLEKYPQNYAMKIRDKVEYFLVQHYKKTFKLWLETDKILCKPSFRLPSEIHPVKSINHIRRSLYESEESMNPLEQALVSELDGLDNIRWIHRNIARQEFFINGFINHYPDIMMMTQSGKLVLIETKGEYLKNDDSRDKIELGDAWRRAAGKSFRYYMVFENDEDVLPGAVSMAQFIQIAQEMG